MIRLVGINIVALLYCDIHLLKKQYIYVKLSTFRVIDKETFMNSGNSMKIDRKSKIILVIYIVLLAASLVLRLFGYEILLINVVADILFIVLLFRCYFKTSKKWLLYAAIVMTILATIVITLRVVHYFL